jgi:hypothetical protein
LWSERIWYLRQWLLGCEDRIFLSASETGKRFLTKNKRWKMAKRKPVVLLPDGALVTKCNSSFRTVRCLFAYSRKQTVWRVRESRAHKKIPMVIKQPESGLHLMSIARNIFLNFLGPIGAWYRRRGERNRYRWGVTVNFCRLVTRSVRFWRPYPVNFCGDRWHGVKKRSK